MLESIQNSPDGYFYYCSAVEMYSKFTEINLLPNGLIEDDIIIECFSYLDKEPYYSGPIFPFFLLIGIIFKLGFLFNIFHIIFLAPIYIYLCNRILTQLDIKQKIKILYAVIFSPLFIWLLIYPSTDIVSSILILCAINYIPLVYKRFNKNLYKNGLNSFLIKTSFLFLLTLFITLLCRPLIWLISPLIVFYFAVLWTFDLKFRKKSSYSNKITIIKFIYSKYFFFLLSILSTFFVISFFFYSKYYAYPFPDNEFQIPGILFDTLSPPAPVKLHEITHRSISEFISSLLNSKLNFLDLFKKLLFLVLSILQSLIFSLLSLSGFQTTSYLYDELNIFRFIMTSYKAVFGLFINLPGIFIVFIESIKAFQILKKEPIEFISNKKNIFSLLAICSTFYCLTLLITVGHIRYLLPILPFLVIGSQMFWRRLINIDK